MPAAKFLCPCPRLTLVQPDMLMAAQVIPTAPLDPFRSKQAARNLGTTTPPAPLKVSSVNTELWNISCHIYPAHAHKIVRYKKLQKMIQSNLDLEHIGQLALSMTSLMDARGHYW